MASRGHRRERLQSSVNCHKRVNYLDQLPVGRASRNPTHSTLAGLLKESGAGEETCGDPSAPADSIDRTTTIHWSSRSYRFSRRSSRDRARSQHHARPHDATGGIIHVLAIHHGRAGFLGACSYECGYQQDSC
jgi:hypothetical protein